MLYKLSKYIDKEAFIKNVLAKTQSHKNIIFDSFVSNTCNLHCRHCYFLDYKPTRTPVTYERWVQIINECIDNDIKHFHFSGKEPFCDQRIHLLLKKLDTLKIDNDLFYGLVSNGTSISSTKCNELLNGNISYIEISIEGYNNYDDLIRGGSHFKRVDNLICQLDDKSKINITSTISETNVESLIQLFLHMIDKGVSKFNIAPLQIFHKEKIRPIIDISTTTMLNLYTKCYELLLKLSNKIENRIDIRICFSQEQAYKLFMSRNILSNDIEKYIYDGTELIYNIGNHILEINYPLLHIPYLSQLVATHDGYIISCADDIHYEDINSISIGNITDESITQILEKRRDYIIKYLTNQL